MKEIEMELTYQDTTAFSEIGLQKALEIMCRLGVKLPNGCPCTVAQIQTCLYMEYPNNSVVAYSDTGVKVLMPGASDMQPWIQEYINADCEVFELNY